MKTVGIVLATIAGVFILFLGGCAVLVGTAADEIEKETQKSTVTSEDSGKSTEKAEKDYSFKGLNVDREEFGTFAGTIKVTNNTSEMKDVIVTVTVFNGDQNLGELIGSAKVKPESTTEVDLDSIDDYKKFTDTAVEVTGF